MKAKNEKGFTIVELLTSFSLATVVMIFLFNILVTVKKSYITNKIETELITNQALLSQALNSDNLKYNLLSIQEDKTSTKITYTINFKDTTTNNKITRRLEITDSTITYDNYIYTIPKNSGASILLTDDGTLKGTSYTSYAKTKKLGYKMISIPIYSSVLEDGTNYGVKIIYMY